MPLAPGEKQEGNPLFGPGGHNTLALVLYLVVAITLMVVDHSHAYLDRARAALGVLAQPLYAAVAAPARFGRALSEMVHDRQSLVAENRELHSELMLAQARMNRLAVVQRENERLRALLGATNMPGLRVQIAQVVDVDLDPFRHRVVLNSGSQQGVHAGQALVDSVGVLGQVEQVSPSQSIVVLISDPNHAIPVRVVRNGLRTIAYGTGRIDSLLLPNIPLSADVQVGDVLETSGLGGRFPAGFPVAKISELRREESGMFIEADATPSAQLDRSLHVLLVWTEAELQEMERKDAGRASDATRAVPPAEAGPT